MLFWDSNWYFWKFYIWDIGWDRYIYRGGRVNGRLPPPPPLGMAALARSPTQSLAYTYIRNHATTHSGAGLLKLALRKFQSSSFIFHYIHVYRYAYMAHIPAHMMHIHCILYSCWLPIVNIMSTSYLLNPRYINVWHLVAANAIYSILYIAYISRV